MATEEQVGGGCALGCMTAIVSGIVSIGWGLFLLDVTKAFGLAILVGCAGWLIGCAVGWWICKPDPPKPRPHRMVELIRPGSTTEIKMNGSTCTCHKCIEQYGITVWGRPMNQAVMVLCSKCGNKRCPHAFDHDLECTNSNEPNQPGAR